MSKNKATIRYENAIKRAIKNVEIAINENCNHDFLTVTNKRFSSLPKDRIKYYSECPAWELISLYFIKPNIHEFRHSLGIRENDVYRDEEIGALIKKCLEQKVCLNSRG